MAFQVGPHHGDFKMKLLAGNSHPALAKKIASILGISMSDTLCDNFANGETRVEIKESCRGADCFVIQPICNTEDGKKGVNDALMELLIMVSALRGSSAERITAVMPIYGYARQDKKDKSRAAISARLVADLLEAAGVDRAMTVDLHASQIQGFFAKPMDNLYAEDLMLMHMKKHIKGELVVVSPDAGGAKRASRVACKLGADVDCAIISKERLKANEVASMRLVGSVKDRIAIIVDDMADTCGTLCLAVDTVRAAGALQVHAYVVHGVLSGPAIERINKCEGLTSVCVTNTLPQTANLKACPKLQVVDCSELIAQAIACTHNNSSISALFKSPYMKPMATPMKAKNPTDSFEL